MNGTTIATVTTDMWTTVAPDDGRNPVRGFICCAVAVLLFGSNFIPVKKFPTGDGLFFQWVMCVAIWLTGLVVQCIRHFPTFYPLAMLGGFLWTTGNIFVVPVIHLIGLSQGMLLWVSFNMMMGWASGRFGLFGLHPEPPKDTTMNYIGMALCLCSAFLYILIKTNTNMTSSGGSDRGAQDEDIAPLLAGQTDTQQNYGSVNSDSGTSTVPEITVVTPGGDCETSVSSQTQMNNMGFQDKIPIKFRRIIGVLMAVVAGTLFGFNFTPVIYIQDNYKPHNETASQNGLDYVFSHFSGILVTSSVYFVLYCIAMKNNPRVYPSVILPGFVSGIMWGVAQISWFIANSDLSETVTFPIISAGPGLLAAIWGMSLFREITGKRNLVILLVAFCVTVTGSVLTGFSLE